MMDRMTPKPFVNRQRELSQLRYVTERGTPSLILVYGRRRVGKTYLLGHAWRGQRVFYFLASHATDEVNRTELLDDLARWSGRALISGDYPSWRAIFRLFVDLAAESPLIVVLDEFQYLLNRGSGDAASQLVPVWDRELRDRSLIITLSGSEVATMENLTTSNQPLFGRFALRLRILPLDYYDARQMVSGRPLRDAAMLFGALGGMPRYLAAVDATETVAETLSRTMLLPSGEVHLQIEQIIEQEQGIRNPAEYRAVLAVIAGGATHKNDVAQKAGLDESIARYVLETLEGLELIWRERNFAAPASGPYRYRIADNAVRFWYHFVHPNRSRLVTDHVETVWNERVEPFLARVAGVDRVAHSRAPPKRCDCHRP